MNVAHVRSCQHVGDVVGPAHGGGRVTAEVSEKTSAYCMHTAAYHHAAHSTTKRYKRAAVAPDATTSDARTPPPPDSYVRTMLCNVCCIRQQATRHSHIHDVWAVGLPQQPCQIRLPPSLRTPSSMFESLTVVDATAASASVCRA